MKKKFIEWDLPLKEISEHSAKESYIRKGHPTSFHKWWARRPLASSRATNFASLIDLPEDPQEREEIKELIIKITPFESVKNGNSKPVKKAREMVLNQNDESPRVLDPFAGGGSIPIEALRLGSETYASDYNPVAVLIEKCMMEWPQKYGISIDIPIKKASKRELASSGYSKKQIINIFNGTHKSLSEEDTIEVNLLSHVVEKYAKKILNDFSEELGHFYPECYSDKLIGKRNIEHNEGWIPVGYIWARTIPCQNPNCNAEIPLIKQFWLSKKKNKKIAYRPIVDEENEEINFEILEGGDLDKAIDEGFDPSNSTVSRANAECLICGQVTDADLTKDLAKNGKMNERMIAVICHHLKETGKKYKIAKNEDLEIINECKKLLKHKIENWSGGVHSPIPNEKIAPIGTYGIDAQRYTENREWGELFNPRQKLSLLTFVELIKNQDFQIDSYIKESIEIDIEKFSKVIKGYLGLIFSNFLNRMSTLSMWYIQGEKIQPTFSRQALPIVWDYVEIYPDNKSSGSWESNLKDIIDGIEMYSFNNQAIFCEKNSATSLPYDDDFFDAIFTDPPYYDNVPYSDLSDYFYVWLKRILGEEYPDLFSTPLTPKSKEAIADPMKHENSKDFFEKLLSDSFDEIHRTLKKDGITTIVYAHKTTSGWESMLNSLVNSGLVVTASWPIHTELKTRLRAAASAALASSIYMVCRKTEREELGFWKDIKPRIKERVEEKLKQFWNEGIIGGDFFISAIGPGMEIYSKYEKVERYSGEEVTTLDLLEYIRSIATDFVVNNLLKGASTTEVDSASQFYLAYRWTYLDNKVEFDDARRIASGMGIELNKFSGKGGFVKQTRKYTRVLGPKERDEVENIDNMVDVMHKAVLLWDEGEKEKIKQLLLETGYGEKPAFWQFCQAVAETLLSGNKEKQLLEGFLMGRDKYSKPSKEPEQAGLDQYGGN